MYQFAKWKYWLVIAVLVIGTIYALPNVFGEGPALQLSRNDRAPMADADVQRVRGILDAKQLAPEASRVEEDRLVLRFADEAQQTKAREEIQSAARTEGKNDYLIALSSDARTPQFMRMFGLKPMSLGLDLRGGVDFTYEVDIQGAINQAVERLERDARQILRDKRIAYQQVSSSNGVVKVVLREAADVEKAREALKSPDNSLQFLDTSSSAEGPTVEFRMTEAETKRRQDLAVAQNITTLRNRVDELGISEPSVTRKAINRIAVQLPGVQDPNEAIRVLGATATLEFRLVDETNDPYEAQRTKRVPIGSKLYKMREGGIPILVKRDIITSGEQLTDATSGFGESGPQVSVKLDSRGGAAMLETTSKNVGRRMAVIYTEQKQLAEGEICEGTRNGQICTEEEVINAATIQGVFSTQFQITGLQQTESRELALLLRSGALAAPQTIVEQRSVGPSLGKDNIERGWQAMAIGLLLTFAFMAVYYRAFGWVANAVLAANLVLTVGLLSMLGVSLSLPGIAAVVFHLGIAVDANILIYERIREELRAGNSPRSAINAGFDKAFATIADSNVTTVIAGVVLFAFGTGTIRSFAIVMTLGILTSMFTSIVGSRALVHFVWGRRRTLERLSI